MSNNGGWMNRTPAWPFVVAVVAGLALLFGLNTHPDDVDHNPDQTCYAHEDLPC